MVYQISDDGTCPKCGLFTGTDTRVRYEILTDPKSGGEVEQLRVSCWCCGYSITQPCADAVLKEAR